MHPRRGVDRRGRDLARGVRDRVPQARLGLLARDRRAGHAAGHPARPRLRRAGRRRPRPRGGSLSTLRITDLSARIGSRQILNGVSLEVSSGEVHALMGPNGSGKSTLSHVLMGHPEYEVTGGSVTLDGEELLGLPTHERAVRGLFLAMQYPIEVPGVGLDAMLRAALEARGIEPNGLTAQLVREAELVGMAPSALGRAVNVAFSGGEKKRNETVQLAVLKPRI